jgi:hypothetical protein
MTCSASGSYSQPAPLVVHARTSARAASTIASRIGIEAGVDHSLQRVEPRRSGRVTLDGHGHPPILGERAQRNETAQPLGLGSRVDQVLTELTQPLRSKPGNRRTQPTVPQVSQSARCGNDVVTGVWTCSPASVRTNIVRVAAAPVALA